MLEYKINKFLELKLENGKTIISINKERFDQCKFLFLINPLEKEPNSEINSIDEASEQFSSRLEKQIKPEELGISPEEEFRAHCSNLQAWAEHNYDTRLLHSNLSFPLLKKLTEIGDELAKKVFKEEIAKRLESGYAPVIEYLINEGYTDYLEKDELFYSLLEPQEAEVVLTLNNLIKNEIIEPAVRLEEDIMPDLYFIVKNRRVIALRLWFLPVQVFPISAVEKISRLSSLEILQLSNCNVGGIPESFSNLQKLKFLNLNEIFIGAFPESITTLSCLEKLNLSRNYISYLPESIKELKNLRELDLGLNKIKTLNDSIGALNNLEILKMDGNELKELPESIGNLRRLKVLKLYNNYLTTLPDSIGKLKSLETLELMNNDLMELPDSIRKLDSLKSINLKYNNRLDKYIEENLTDIITNLKSISVINVNKGQFDMLSEQIKKMLKRKGIIFYN